MEGETELQQAIKQLLASTTECLTSANLQNHESANQAVKKIIEDLKTFEQEQMLIFDKEHPNISNTESEMKVKNLFNATLKIASSLAVSKLHDIYNDQSSGTRLLNDASEALCLVPDSLELFEYFIRKWCQVGVDVVEDLNDLLETIGNIPRNPVLYSDFGCINDWKAVSVEELHNKVTSYRDMLIEVFNTKKEDNVDAVVFRDGFNFNADQSNSGSRRLCLWTVRY